MRGRFFLLFLAGIAAVAPLAALADVNGLSVSPAHSDPNNPASRSYFIHSVAPGGSFSDQVQVSNTGATAISLYVSAVDGLTGVTSGAVYGNRQDQVHKAGTWVTPDRTQMSVGRGGTALAGFTVQVPADATPGDHLAGIAFEDAAPSTSGNGFQVTTVVRAVVGVLVQVPGPASFHIHLDQPVIQALNAQSHLASVVVQIGDDGRLLGKPRLTISLNGPNGYHNTVSRNLDTLLPGDTIPYPFPWPDTLYPGTYTVDVTASATGMASPARLTTTVELDAKLQGVPNSGTPAALRPPSEGLPAWLLGLTVVGLVLLAAIAALLAILVLRPSRRQRRERQEQQSARWVQERLHGYEHRRN